jgi:hypothetical protein
MSQNLILVDALFLLNGGRRRRGKRKKKEREIAVGEEGLPGARHTLLAGPWVASVRYN